MNQKPMQFCGNNKLRLLVNAPPTAMPAVCACAADNVRSVVVIETEVIAPSASAVIWKFELSGTSHDELLKVGCASGALLAMIYAPIRNL